MLKIADEFFAEFGVVPPKSQLRFAHEHIFSRYAAATKKWEAVVARLDSDSIDAFVLSRAKAEDRLAAWLDDLQGENDIGDGQSKRSSPGYSKLSKSNQLRLYRCSWCGNPSAVLRRCGGCEKARYDIQFFV